MPTAVLSRARELELGGVWSQASPVPYIQPARVVSGDETKPAQTCKTPTVNIDHEIDN